MLPNASQPFVETSPKKRPGLIGRSSQTRAGTNCCLVDWVMRWKLGNAPQNPQISAPTGPARTATPCSIVITSKDTLKIMAGR